MVPGLPRPDREPTELEEEQQTWAQPRNTEENQAKVQAALQDFSEGPSSAFFSFSFNSQ